MAHKDVDIFGCLVKPILADLDGGSTNIFPGYSTGLGRATLRLKKGRLANSSSSVLNTFVDGLILGGAKVLANTVTTNILLMTVQTLSTVAIYLRYLVEAQNGVDLQYEVGSVTASVMNKAGVYTISVLNAIDKNAHTAGSIAVVWSTNDSVNLAINVNSSLTNSSGFPRVSYSVQNLSNQEILLY